MICFVALHDNESVMDQLSLCIWLEGKAQAERLRNFEKLLRLFPFSQREQPQSIVSIHAVDMTEPPLLERPLNGPLDIEEALATLRDYEGEDVGYWVESWWDLWQFDGDWRLQPARVALGCFGPRFDSQSQRSTAHQEDLRIEFGPDVRFLPSSNARGGARLIESNIKSLLSVVHEIDSSLATVKRRLETESGENFAQRLQQALSGERVQ